MDATTGHLLEAVVVALPAIIAAVSSLRNHRESKRHNALSNERRDEILEAINHRNEVSRAQDAR